MRINPVKNIAATVSAVTLSMAPVTTKGLGIPYYNHIVTNQVPVTVIGSDVLTKPVKQWTNVCESVFSVPNSKNVVDGKGVIKDVISNKIEKLSISKFKLKQQKPDIYDMNIVANDTVGCAYTNSVSITNLLNKTQQFFKVIAQ